MNDKTHVNLQIWPETRDRFRLLARLRGQTICKFADDLTLAAMPVILEQSRDARQKELADAMANLQPVNHGAKNRVKP